MMPLALEACMGMSAAQRRQDRHGHLRPGEKVYYVLPGNGRWFRFWVWLTAPRHLYRQIEWHKDGAVFFARK